MSSLNPGTYHNYSDGVFARAVDPEARNGNPDYDFEAPTMEQYAQATGRQESGYASWAEVCVDWTVCSLTLIKNAPTQVSNIKSSVGMLCRIGSPNIQYATNVPRRFRLATAHCMRAVVATVLVARMAINKLQMKSTTLYEYKMLRTDSFPLYGYAKN